MTPDQFRKLALSFPNAEESSHMDHPDFRVGGKIFATLAPDSRCGMAKLLPHQQKDLMDRFPIALKPAAGKWGEGGATLVVLTDADKEIAGEALTLAYQNIVAKKK